MSQLQWCTCNTYITCFTSHLTTNIVIKYFPFHKTLQACFSHPNEIRHPIKHLYVLGIWILVTLKNVNQHQNKISTTWTINVISTHSWQRKIFWRNMAVQDNTWYDRIMACTARWSSMTFSFIWPPSAGAPEPPRYGAILVTGTWLRPGAAREGGGWYAWPGAAPAALLRKNESHDCNKHATEIHYLNTQSLKA